MRGKAATFGQQQTPERLRLVLLSDTHELHREVAVPDGDVLIHSGDFTMMSHSLRNVEDFDLWLGELPHPYKLLVPGNHEFFLEEDPRARGLIRNATLLINRSVEIHGLRFWGSPVTPLCNGAFGIADESERAKIYRQISSDVDVLISHGPPYGILDREPGSAFHAGCRELYRTAMYLCPILHVFGHVHSAYGLLETEETLFANAALLGPFGDLANPPLVIDLQRKGYHERIR